jgi:peptidyl-prolyl cis-trans isomerase A (cyclophilin A)
MTSITVLSLMALGLGACLSASAVAGQGDGPKPVVVLDTSVGAITLELYPDKAPITVENFLKYVDEGFYDNLIFHRVMKDFMIQTGGMTDQMGEKYDDAQQDWKEKHPPIKNESGKGLSNERGTIAMARTNNPDSATCQFFINHGNNARLDNAGGGYSVFGKVIKGMDVVDTIAKTATTTRGGHENVPVKPIYIKSAKRKTK